MSRDMFLEIEGIKGESQDHGHKEWIDILSWSWGMSQSGSAHEGLGSGAGKVNVQDINFSKRMDKATTVLMQRCADGKYLKKAKFVQRKAMGEAQLDYLVIEFEDCIISSYQTGGSGDDIPIDSFSMNFAQHKVIYTPQENDVAGAAVEHGWSMRKNEKL